jgi:prenyltransferase beta subunit
VSSVPTGMISSPPLGVWHRLGLLSRHGSLRDMDPGDLVGKLDEVGIARHHYGLARAVGSWQQGDVPPGVALALWFLRLAQHADGGFGRFFLAAPEDTGPTIRYIQLAVAYGETMSGDEHLARAVGWLLKCQQPDGSIPANLGFGYGEAGTTARAVRALQRIDDPEVAECVDRMCEYLLRAVVLQESGVAWTYSKVERIPVTGATSLAALALLERGVQSDVPFEACRYLRSCQAPTGGWAEVPGHSPTIHNSFNVLRTLFATEGSELVQQGFVESRDRAARWLLNLLGRQRARSVSDAAFGLRLCVTLDLLGRREAHQLGRFLSRRLDYCLSDSADLYADTEITAIALAECAQALRPPTNRPVGPWAWLWALPPTPPPFLRHSSYFYDLLYSASRRRVWVRCVDFLARMRLAEAFVALLLGMVVSLGTVDDRVIAAYVSHQSGWRAVFVLLAESALLLGWMLIKVAIRRTIRGILTGTLASVLVSVAILVFLTATISSRLSAANLVVLQALVIDVIAFTADSSGLLNRLFARPERT